MSTPRESRVTGNVISDADYAKIKVGLKSLEDAVLNLGSYKKLNPNMTKEMIQRAMASGNGELMREASDFYFRMSGIYYRLCKHFSTFYRYDWFITPHKTGNKITPEKIIEGFNRVSYALNDFGVKRFLGDAALGVFKNGCYYGYLIQDGDSFQVQELLPKYCRSRYSIKGRPAVEFNMKFFDDFYTSPEQRIKILKMFPRDFQKGYIAYKEGKLPAEAPGESAGWYLLDIDCAIKFNMNKEDYPPLMSVIPHIIDLEAAQELDRKKMAQKLLKILIQKMPLDKNGELIFDIDEAQELHNNAVKMLGKAIGIDVLTTFAEVDVADLADKNTATSTDELGKVERTVYNEAGTAQNLFNTDGNIALEKSILDDEANLFGLILQFQDFLNYLIKPFNKNAKKFYYEVQILPTTVYNYKDMSKLYRDNGAAGGSKMLAGVALGQTQSAILATAEFENEILDISNLFASKQTREENKSKITTNRKPETQVEETGEVGRKEKPDDQKSEKTIANRESMS